ncbi:FAD-dependent oxidoreductase [Brevibacterium oceani]|uniref:FAD-dependent oxidoreductase n=1 Tax=Brevibacterium oceani TaxID=358099 RepID=UPI001B31D28A|nr:FAD-dependent oxidoreductase [Brevibacterium oceani]
MTTRATTPQETACDVLVIGGGLVGLAAGAFLAQHGVDVTVVERHPSTSLHPKARLVTVRSMELYSSLGIDDEIRTAGEPNGGFAVAADLSAEHDQWVPPADDESAAAHLSPFTPYSCDQQRIEPILRTRAEELGARVLFGTQASDISEGEHEVSARLDRNGTVSTLRARYLLAADGARSTIRRNLGIGLDGEPVPGTAVSALFSADLSPALHGRVVDALMARNAEAFLFARGNESERQWQLGTHQRPEWSNGTDLSTQLASIIRAATGLPELDPHIDSVLTWSTGAYVAQRLSAGRIFLLGDAAHQMPPYGGFGGNTGVQDAHNLAWKLAAVCRGEADSRLLDSYEIERGPLVRLIVEQALLRSRKTPGQPAPPEQIDSATLSLGSAYPPISDTAAKADSAIDALTSAVEDPRDPSGRPGTRAPHIALSTSSRSTLGILDPVRFTFIADDRSPTAAALSERPPAALAIRTVAPGSAAAEHRQVWDRIYSGSDCDGVLVRPDHVIAWRAPKGLADPVSAVSSALATALGHGPQWRKPHDQASGRVT